MKKTLLLLLTLLVLHVPRSPAQLVADRRLDSLTQALRRQTRPDTSRVQTLLRLADAYVTREPARSAPLLREAQQLAEKLRFGRGVARAYYQWNVYYYSVGEYPAAHQAAEQARQHYRQLGDSLRMGRSILGDAAAYLYEGDFPAATRQLTVASRLFDRHHADADINAARISMGVVQLVTNRFAEALTYFEQARDYFQVHDPNKLVNIYLNLGTVNMELKRFAEARRNMLLLLEISRKQGNRLREADALHTLGQLEYDLDHYPESQRYLEQSVQINQELGAEQNVGESLLSLGDALMEQGKYKESNAVFQRAMVLAQRFDVARFKQKAYRGLARSLAGLGQYQRAFELQRLATSWRDSVLNEDNLSEIADMRTKYETEKKEAQNQLLLQQKQVQAARLRTQQQVIRRRNVQLVAGLVIAGLLLGLGYSLYTRRRLRREVEFAQERQQLERLRSQAVLEAEEAERRRIGSDLHDGVGQLLTAAKLNLHALGEQLHLQTEGQQVMLQNALDVVDESFREVRTISHNLMPNALIKRGLAQAVRDFLSKISPDDRLKIQLEVVGLDRGGRLEATVENVLFRVIQELAQNIVKHAQATQLTLQIIRREQELTIMVEDNGVGFDPAGLGEEAGIGLKNIESRMAYLGGRAEFDSSPGRGTTVTLEVPLTPQTVAS